MGPGREVGKEFLIMFALDGYDVMLCLVIAGFPMGACIRVGILRLLDITVLCLFNLGIAAGGLGEFELAGLGEGEACIESCQCRHQRETDEDTPDFVGIVSIAGLEVRFETGEGDDGDQRADERAPSLVGEDKGEEGASTVNVGAIWMGNGQKNRGFEAHEKWSGHTGYDGCAHGIITTDTDTEDDTANEDP
jgi:hypothetical protein